MLAFRGSAYVVMPEHVHLLMSEPERGALETALQALKLSVMKKSVQRPFWLARYYDFNVWGQRKVVEKRKYIHRNPVERGLVTSPEGWKWSSYRSWLTREAGVVEVDCEFRRWMGGSVRGCRSLSACSGSGAEALDELSRLHLGNAWVSELDDDLRSQKKLKSN